jgi:hypothetical protein
MAVQLIPRGVKISLGFHFKNQACQFLSRMVALLALKSTICNPVSFHFSCTDIFSILSYFSVLSANGICMLQYYTL